jgi:antitoxin component of RelBE/YafQ-DinJ toxin-antitoxin module
MSTKEKKGDMSSVSFRLKRSQKKDVAGIANKLGVSTSTLLQTWVTRILNNMNGLGDHAEMPRDK